MPTIYGIEHIIYLLIVIAIAGITFLSINKYVRTSSGITVVIKLLGLLLLTSIVWNRISIAIGRDDVKLLWPDSFCGTSSLVLALSVIILKKNNLVLHCVSYIGLLGGLVTLVYPDFIGQADSIFYPMTISGLLHHTVMAFLVIIMLKTGYLKPALNKWYVVPIGLTIYMTYGLFLITVIGLEDAMYIYEPILSGTPLNWFVLGGLFIPLHLLFLVVWEKYNEKRNKLINQEHSGIDEVSDRKVA